MTELRYDPETGKLWRNGKEAGCLNSWGYRQVQIEKRLYKAHRVAWCLFHGVWPEGDLDHINGNRADNRIANLRESTRSENMCNRGKTRLNTSGYKGAYWHKSAQKWMASITINGKQKYLGLFDSPEAASEAYNMAALKYHGDFANLDL